MFTFQFPISAFAINELSFFNHLGLGSKFSTHPTTTDSNKCFEEVFIEVMNKYAALKENTYSSNDFVVYLTGIQLTIPKEYNIEFLQRAHAGQTLATITDITMIKKTDNNEIDK